MPTLAPWRLLVWRRCRLSMIAFILTQHALTSSGTIHLWWYVTCLVVFRLSASISFFLLLFLILQMLMSRLDQRNLMPSLVLYHIKLFLTSLLPVDQSFYSRETVENSSSEGGTSWFGAHPDLSEAASLCQHFCTNNLPWLWGKISSFLLSSLRLVERSVWRRRMGVWIQLGSGCGNPRLQTCWLGSHLSGVVNQTRFDPEIPSSYAWERGVRMSPCA